jgi:hypothetical protein
VWFRDRPEGRAVSIIRPEAIWISMGVDLRSQRGGTNSTNYQAEAINVFHAPTAAEVLEIARELQRDNLHQMQGVARLVVEERLAFFEDRLLERLLDKGPQELAGFGDPDVQYSLIGAQRDFARLGTEQLGNTLVELLVARCVEPTGGLRAMALGQAIDAIPRITSGQIDAMTANWLVRRFRPLGIHSEEDLWARLSKYFGPLADTLPKSESPYRHLIAIGCASPTAPCELGGSLRATFPGIFTRGFTRHSVTDLVASIPNLIVQYERDPTLVRVNAIDLESALLRAGVDEATEVAREVRNLLSAYSLPDSDVVDRVLDSAPELRPLNAVWETTPISSIDLTPVGEAIAHCRWQIVAAEESPLSNWIPDD